MSCSKPRTVILLTCAFAVFARGPHAGADVVADPAYGVGGATASVFGATSQVRVAAMAFQPDGKLVVAGRGIPDPSVGHAGADMIVARLLRNGTPDPDFGTGGRVVIQLNPTCSTCYEQQVAGLRVLANEKIVVGGAVRDAFGAFRPAVVRLTSSGVPDPSFGTGGIAIDTGSAPSIFVSAGDVVGLPGGKVGWVGQGFGTTLVLRFDAIGGLDTGFATGGRLEQALPGTLFSSAFGAAGLTDGSILTAGTSTSLWYTSGGGARIGDYTKLAFASITDGGVVDGGAGTPSFHVKPFPDATDGPEPQPEDVYARNEVTAVPRIVPRVGSSDWWAPFSSAWSQSDSTGFIPHVPGSGVGLQVVGPSGGTTRTDFVERPLTSYVLDVATDPTGRVYVLNHRQSNVFVVPGPEQNVYEVIRFTADGTLDATFADAGVLTLDRPTAPSAIAVQDDGALLVGGTAATSYPRDAQVVRISRATLDGAATPPVRIEPPLPESLVVNDLRALRYGVACDVACSVKVKLVVQVGGTAPSVGGKRTTLASKQLKLRRAGARAGRVAASSSVRRKVAAALKGGVPVWVIVTYSGKDLGVPVTQVALVAP